MSSRNRQTEPVEPVVESPVEPESEDGVWLATWHGGSDIHRVWDDVFELGVQRAITRETADRIVDDHRFEVVYTVKGSEFDVRIEPYVVPPQPEGKVQDEPDPGKIDILGETLNTRSAEHDATPTDKKEK